MKKFIMICLLSILILTTLSAEYYVEFDGQWDTDRLFILSFEEEGDHASIEDIEAYLDTIVDTKDGYLDIQDYKGCASLVADRMTNEWFSYQLAPALVQGATAYVYMSDSVMMVSTVRDKGLLEIIFPDGEYMVQRL